MADDLARWAAERAPELVARAEAEAVAQLRTALVEAALASRSRSHEASGGASATRAISATPPRAREPRDRSGSKDRERSSGYALWTYCVLPAGDWVPTEAEGVAPPAPIERIDGTEVGVLVSRVPLGEFASEPLRENLNDIEWLERVARSHEDVLDRALRASPIVPLRLCTIYESEASVRTMLEREQLSLSEALAVLTGREEWGVKVIVDPDRLAEHARGGDATAALEDDASSSSGGRAYMRRRRAERETREAADNLASEIAERVHARLQELATDAVTRPPQNRDLSGHEGEMLLNAAYLVESERVEGLAELVAELETRYSSLGAHIELTGPWPPYNFVPGGDAAALA